LTLTQYNWLQTAALTLTHYNLSFWQIVMMCPRDSTS